MFGGQRHFDCRKTRQFWLNSDSQIEPESREKRRGRRFLCAPALLSAGSMPATDHVTEPVTDPVTEPVTAPCTEQVIEPVPGAVNGPVTGSVNL